MGTTLGHELDSDKQVGGRGTVLPQTLYNVKVRHVRHLCINHIMVVPQPCPSTSASFFVFCNNTSEVECHLMEENVYVL